MENNRIDSLALMSKHKKLKIKKKIKKNNEEKQEPNR